MFIGGLQKTTLIDFPGKIAATIFTIGCPFRCSYCHNPELVVPSHYTTPISQEFIFEFLAKRVGKLDGICITGGEPTMHKDMRHFIARIKHMGFAVKLDTNGAYPSALREILQDGNVDYIAMDIKSPLDRYSEIIGPLPMHDAVAQSVNLIMTSGFDYEFRTTVAHPLLSVDDFDAMGMLIKGASRYFIQNYVKAPKQVEQSVALEPFSDQDLSKAVDTMKKYVQEISVR